jgi:HSP20 family protein
MSNQLPVNRNVDWWPDFFEPFRSLSARVQDFFSPSAEAGATDGAYDIALELPGVKESDIDISINGNVLTVKGDKHSEKEEKGKTYYFSERTYGSFQRTFRLPANVHSDTVKASFENGVLHIKLPKLEEKKENTKKIEIESK